MGVYKLFEYLKLNLNGLIFVMVDGDGMVMYEMVVILMYLVDMYLDVKFVLVIGIVVCV